MPIALRWAVAGRATAICLPPFTFGGLIVRRDRPVALPHDPATLVGPDRPAGLRCAVPGHRVVTLVGDPVIDPGTIRVIGTVFIAGPRRPGPSRRPDHPDQQSGRRAALIPAADPGDP